MTTPADPPMILVVPDTKVDALPAAVRADLNRCESAYSRGTWFVTVPAEVYRAWPVVDVERS